MYLLNIHRKVHFYIMNRLQFALTFLLISISTNIYCEESKQPPSPKPQIKSISFGTSEQCLILLSGKVKCWGAANSVGTFSASAINEPTLVPELENVLKLHIGGEQACAQFEQGKLKCWSGIWDKSTAGAKRPTTINFPHQVKDISLGLRHACILADTGEVYCKGANDKGNLGSGVFGWASRSEDLIKVKLPGKVKQVGASGYNSCALIDDGTVYCWGDNSAGQLGTKNQDAGETVQKIKHLEEKGDKLSPIPLKVEGLADKVKSLYVNGNYSCAILESEKVQCWGHFPGYKEFLKIDVMDSVTQVFTPYLIPNLNSVKSLGLSGHACALKNNGDVLCWPESHIGATGRGGKSSSPFGMNTPTKITDIDPVSAIFVSSDISCALQMNGLMKCWGAGFGLLGNGGIDNPDSYLLSSPLFD